MRIGTKLPNPLETSLTELSVTKLALLPVPTDKCELVWLEFVHKEYVKKYNYYSTPRWVLVSTTRCNNEKTNTEASIPITQDKATALGLDSDFVRKWAASLVRTYRDRKNSNLQYTPQSSNLEAD